MRTSPWIGWERITVSVGAGVHRTETRGQISWPLLVFVSTLKSATMSAARSQLRETTKVWHMENTVCGAENVGGQSLKLSGGCPEEAEKIN